MAREKTDPLAGLEVTDLGSREITVTTEMVARFLEGIGRSPRDGGSSIRDGMPAPSAILHYEPHRLRSAAARAQFAGARSAFNNSIAWEFVRPITIGEVVTTRYRIVDRYLRRGRDHIVYELEVASQDQREVIAKAIRISSHVADPSITPELLPVRDDPDPKLIGPLGVDAVRSVTFLTYEMSCLISGPEPSFHTDRAMAAERGFSEVVISAPHMLSICSAAIEEMAGSRWASGGRISLRMLKPVLAGQEFAVKVAPVGEPDEVEQGVQSYNVVGECDGRTVSCVGTAKVRL